jgi:titin
MNRLVAQSRAASAVAASFCAVLLASCGGTTVPPALQPPEAPAQVVATGGDAQIALSWTASARATSYSVRRAASATGSFSEVGTPSANAFTDTGLGAGTTWFYVVRARNGAGDSADSAIATATTTGTTPGVPAAPTGLTATGGAAKISLTWTQPAGATGARVLRSLTSGGAYAPIGTATTGAYDDTGLAASAKFFYVVQATNAAGHSVNSNEASATTNPAAGAPAAPASLAAVGGTKSIALSWPAVTGATGYVVLRSTQSGAGYAQLPTVPATNSFTDSGLADGAGFFYVVRATNANGTSANSPEAGAETLPALPEAFTATGGQNQIALAWGAVTSATRYQVFRADTAGHLDVSKPPLAEPTTASFIDVGLGNSEAWVYVVRAVNSAGPGPTSAAQGATTLPRILVPPPAPASLAATGLSNAIKLTWPAVGTATGYLVFRGAVSGTYPDFGTGKVVATSACVASLCAFTDDTPALADGATFFYVVQATNADGASPNVGPASAVTFPGVPTNLAAAGGQNQIAVTWTAVATATRYQVFSSASSTVDTSGTPLAQPTAASYTDTGLADSATRFYVVRAVNASGSSAFTAPKSATTNPPAQVAPGKPASLTATAGIKSITLTWPVVANASDYLLLRGTSSGTYATVTGVTPSCTATTCTAFDNTAALTDGAGPFFYVVDAHNAVGTSPHSPEASATVLPGVPTGVSAAAVSGVAKSILVKWTAVQNPVATGDAYVLLRGTTAVNGVDVGAHITSAACTAGACQFTDHPPADAVAYYYQVAAYNAVPVLGTPSAVVSATTVLAPPVLTATPRSGTQGAVDVAWSAIPAGATFKLWHDVGATPSGAPLFSTTTSTAFGDTGLGDNSLHDYVATFTDAQGNASPASNTPSATTAPGQPAPTAAARDLVNGAIDISWAPTAGAPTNTYLVMSGVRSVCAASTSTSCGDTGRGDNTTVAYQVTAINAAGVSSAAGTASGTTVPAVVSSFSASAPQGPAVARQINLTWTPSTGAATYTIQRRLAGTSSFTTIATPASAPYGDTGLADSTAYDYQISAVASGKGSAYTVKTVTTTPPQVTLSAAQAGTSSIALSWSSAGAANAYRVFRGTTPGSAAVAAAAGTTYTTVAAGTLAFTDSNLAPDTLYYYALVAFDAVHTLTGPASTEQSARTAAVPVLVATPKQNLLSVDLSWATVAGATSLALQRADYSSGCPAYPGGAYAVVTGAGALATAAVSFTDSGGALTAGKTYCYVLAPSGAGTSASLPASATLAAAPPVTLTATPLASDPRGLTMTVAWTYGTSTVPGTLLVYRCSAAGTGACTPSSGSTLVKTVTGPTASGSFDDAGLTAATTYAWLALGQNAAGSYVTGAPTASKLTGPTAPTGLGAVASRPSNNQITLTWNALGAGLASSYVVLRGTSSGSYPDFPDSVSTGKTVLSGACTATCAFTDDNGGAGLPAGTSYFYAVRAANASGTSALSSEATAITLPADLGAVTVTPGQNSLALSWSAVTGAASYQVFRAASASSTVVDTSGAVYATSTSAGYTNVGLGDSETWYYAVRAVNAAGAGGAGLGHGTTLPPAVVAPGAPASLTATAQSKAIQLQWPAVSGAQDYLVFRGTVSGSYGAGTQVLSSACTAGTCTYSDGGLADGSGPFFYAVKAHNTAGTSGFSPEASTTVLAGTPATFTAAAVSGTAKTIVLQWTAVANPASGAAYELLRSTTQNGTYAQIVGYTTAQACSGTTCSMTDASAPLDGTPYWFKIAAFNSAGALGPPTPAVTATTVLPAPTLTAAPLSGTQGEIDLTWSSLIGAANYKLWRDQGATPSGTVLATPASASFNDTGLGDHTTHQYVVAAIDAAGNASPFSNLSSATTAPGQPAPTAAARDLTNGTIDVSWPAAAGAATYLVKSGARTVCAAQPGLTCADTGQGDNATVSYQVTATDSNSISSAPGATSATTVPQTPTLTVATPQGPALTGQLNLSWTASTGATSYVVQRRTGANAFATITPTATGATSAKDTGLSDSVAYDYQISAVASGKGSAFSALKTGVTTPPQVANFTATAVDATSISLSWSAVTTPGTTISYRVFRGAVTGTGTAGTLLTPVAGPGTGTITTTDTGLSPNTSYFYVVVARDTTRTLDGPASAESTAKTQAAVSGALSATAQNGQLKVDLSWGPVAGATGYALVRATSSGCPAYPNAAYATVPNAGGFATSTLAFTDSDGALLAGTSYCYVLVPSGGGTLPSPAQGVILAAPAPSSLTATTLAGDPRGLTVHVAWSYGSAPPGTALLSLYRCSAAGTGACTPTSGSTLVTTVNNPGASGNFDDAGLAPSTTYRYLALGSNTSGAYAAGAPTSAATTGPSTPVGVAAVAGVVSSKNVITVTWTAITDGTVASYVLLRGPSSGSYPDFSGGLSVPTSNCSGATCTFVDDNGGLGFGTGVTEHYAVKAASTQGGSPFTSLASSDVSATTAAPSPTGLTAVASIPGGTRQVALSWGSATGATAYDIYGSTSTPVSLVAGNRVLANVAALNATVNSGLAAGTTYYYRVTVAGDTSRVSNEASALTAPGAPTLGTLTVTDSSSASPCTVGQQCVTIPWTPSANAASFTVYRRIAPGGTFSILATGLGASPYFDTPVNPDTTYEYYVTATNSGGDSPASASASIASLPSSFNTLAAVPSTDATSVTTARRITLSWTLPPNSTATGVWIYRRLSGGAFDFNSPIATNQASPYVDAAVASDSTYDYVARPGISGSGVSATNSNIVFNKLTLPDAPVVTFAGSLASVTSECATPDCIVISWPALPADVTGYSVFGSDTGASYSAVSGTSTCSAGTCRFSEQNLLPGKVRFYKVSATNATGAGPLGAMPGTASAPPPAPTALAVQGGIGTIGLSWNGASGATQYKLERKPGGSGSYGAPVIVVGQSTCTDAGAVAGAPINCSLGALTDGQFYDYRITSQLVVGGSTVVDGGFATITGQVNPATPAGLTVVRASPGTVTLTWSHSTCATAYDLFQASAAAGPFNAATPAQVAAPASPCTYVGTVTANVTGLTDGSSYWYELTSLAIASDASTSSATSAAVKVTLQPAAPVLVSANPGTGQVTVTWNASAGATSYNLYRDGVKIVTGATSPYVDSTVSNGTTYSYTVTAVNTGGESGQSNAKSATPTAASVQAPTGPAAVGLDGGVRVLWDYVAPPSGPEYTYTVYRRTTSGQSSSDAAVGSCTGVSGGTGLRRSCIVTGLANGTTYYFVVRTVSGGTQSADSAEASASAARELCVSLPDMGAVVAIDADTVLPGTGSPPIADAFPRRWFGNVTQLASPVAVAVDATHDELYVLNQDASSVTVYSPRAAAGNTPPVRTIAGSVTALVTPQAMVVDTAAREVFVANKNSTTRMAVYSATSTSPGAPLRQFSDKGYFKALALGPGSNEFTATDGSTVYVYSRTWTGTAPTPRSFWNITGVTDIASIAIDPTTNEIWLANGGPTTGNSSVYAILGGTAASHAASGTVTASRSFSLPLTSRRALSLAYDATGETGAPELLVGSFSNSVLTRQLAAYVIPASGTPTLSTTYNALASGVLQALGRITSMVVDGSVIVAANTAPGGVAPYLQSVTAFKKGDQTSAAIAYSLNGPYQSGTLPPPSDAPQGLAATSAAADQLWVANKGIPGGASSTSDRSSTTNPYGMTTATRAGSPLGFAVDNYTYLGNQQSRGVAVNEAASEVYVSDGASSVLVFDSTTGQPLAGANGTVSTALDVPQGLFWEKGQQRLYIAVNGPSGTGAVDVWTRGGTGAFTHTTTITDSTQQNFLNPSAVWVTTPASGNRQLWIASAGGVSSAGPGAVRMDLVTGTYSAPFYELSLTPTSVVTDATRAYVGQTANGSAAWWGVGVVSGSATGATSRLGYFQIAGATKNIAGLAWCNQQ